MSDIPPFDLEAQLARLRSMEEVMPSIRFPRSATNVELLKRMGSKNAAEEQAAREAFVAFIDPAISAALAAIPLK